MSTLSHYWQHYEPDYEPRCASAAQHAGPITAPLRCWTLGPADERRPCIPMDIEAPGPWSLLAPGASKEAKEDKEAQGAKARDKTLRALFPRVTLLLRRKW